MGERTGRQNNLLAELDLPSRQRHYAPHAAGSQPRRAIRTRPLYDFPATHVNHLIKDMPLRVRRLRTLGLCQGRVESFMDETGTLLAMRIPSRSVSRISRTAARA